MLHSLSQVANATPHYPQTPGAASTATGYGAMHAYSINTPYTPSAQTPFMTPYQTPGQPTPRYGGQTPSQHINPYTSANAMDWKKAAEDWAKQSTPARPS